jgi:hypothetical protein
LPEIKAKKKLVERIFDGFRLLKKNGTLCLETLGGKFKKPENFRREMKLGNQNCEKTK